jgi:hypothetical protein
MSTTAVTPQASDNPFDTPLPSEVQEHQQASASTVAAGGNPFDDPLPSEKAEQQAKTNPEQAASNTRQMLVSGLTGMPTPNMTDADKASFENGRAAGAISVPAVAGAISLSAAAPLVQTLAEHLPTLDKAYKILTAIGAGSYTVQHLKDVMKIIGGGGK